MIEKNYWEFNCLEILFNYKKMFLKYGKNITHFFKSFHKKLSYSEEIKKCIMISKKYINHDTFIAEYQSEDKNLIEVPVGMHVNIM